MPTVRKSPASSPRRTPPPLPDSATAASGLSDAERIRVLERENAKLREEREILRKAAKYFAEETNW
mgnify:CR=1 FL=1